MLRKNLASSRLLRVGVYGLLTLTVAAVVTVDSAEARRRHRQHHARHSPHNDEGSYSPAFASIVVDGNSGATLTATNPDALRHPASLTKIMTLYLLFERLDSGKMKLDTEMPVSEHASEQSPTKLGLRPGQSIRVEDAIKGLVTRSANDAAVVIAEAIGGDEDEFAKMMTRKARSLGMSRTTYVNASGLPADAQITTARDQSILGRAIQDRFPRYYRYFSTVVFNYRGQSIRNHNHLLGNVEGIDGIKTGYTRASGFNIVTSLRRGNRHLVGVVLGGRSGGSRDAIMRNLLAENLDKGATRRTVAAIGERGGSDGGDGADQSPVQLASAAPEQVPAPSRAAKIMSTLSEATAALPPAAPKETKIEQPAPMTSGVIQSPPMALVPGSTEPMKPVKVRTVQVKAGAVKLATAAPQPVAPAPAPFAQRVEAIEPAPPIARAEAARPDMPPQPPGHGTGNGILGVLPASSLPPASSQAMAYAAQPSPPATQLASASPAPEASARPAVTHSGWIIQVGALDSETEAQKRIEAARSSAQGLLSKADPFTETVSKGDKTLIRARFAGLDRDQAEAVCKKLKRADISCMTVRN
ncbi:serine hydrolase [Bradyrhizobium oligotrophicum]|uniref:serine hydrolase n=1 Tax=Bradyrhizobium oligotrophicum TaxID=44255 RepID=UPI003EB6BDBF